MVICPYCGKEMLKGYLIGDRRALRWQPDDREMLGNLYRCGGLPIGSHGLMKRADAITWYCSYCRKMIIEVDDC